MRESYYESSPHLSRERRNYKLDIEQLKGYNPIWGFAFSDTVTIQDVYRGRMFIRNKCEMSTSEYNMSDNMMILELSIPDELLKVGKTHNSCYYAMVFPYIKREYFIQAYKITYRDDNVDEYGHCFWELRTLAEQHQLQLFEDGFRTISGVQYREIQKELEEKVSQMNSPLFHKVK